MADADTIFWGPLASLKAMIAASATFAAACGEDPAATHVYCPGLPAAGAAIAAARPFALVDQGPDRTLRRVSSSQFTGGGSIDVFLEANVAAGHLGDTAAKWAAAHQAFLVFAGQVAAEVVALGSQAGNLNVTGVSLVAGPSRPAPADVLDADDADSEGDFYQIVLRFTWGVGP